jgi:hypothetical protein
LAVYPCRKKFWLLPILTMMVVFAKFLVGLQDRDPALARHLQANRIPFVIFDGAELFPSAGGRVTGRPRATSLSRSA